jgi:hypothetical protein
MWWRINDSLGIEDGPHPPPPDLHSKWYDKQGRLIDLFNASELLSDPDYKRVAEDVFVMDGEPVRVSTVWLGLDHNWMGGRLLIFETMIFGGSHDLCAWRYTTEDEAKEGHAEAVTLLQLELGVLDEPDDVRDEQQRGRPDPNGE